MAKKAPGFYKKSLTEKELQRKYLKFLEQLDDKTFVQSCYMADGETLRIREDLSDKEVKRLEDLKSAIQKNRKLAVKLLPLILIGAIIAGIVFFFTVLANPLLQKGLETGLEAIFEARVNANRFRLSLLRFEVSMNSLTIADRDEPMKNLIQLSQIRVKLKPEAVLRGRVYIEEIRADNMRFGTDRTVSGAIPGRPPRERAAREPVSIPPLVDLGNFDPIALLNQEFEKLQTPRLFNTAWEAYDTALDKWKGEQEAVRARVAELQSRAEPFLRINVNDFRTLDANTIAQIRTIIEDINALTNTVQAAQNDVNRIVAEAEGDINTARYLEQSARNAFATDFNHLRAYLDPGSGAIMEVLESVIWNIFTESAETYLAYGQRALEILEKIKELQERLPKSSPRPPRELGFQGRDVVFPTRQYPRFFMGTLVTDVHTPSDWYWGFDLRGVSSDPDASGIPTTLALSLAETGDGLQRSGAFNGMADFRSNASQRFNAELSGGGFPVDISANLRQIGIGGFSGGAAFRVNLAGNADGSFSGGGDISLVHAMLSNPANTFARAADEAIQRVNTVDLGIFYERLLDERDIFSLNTNFGDILKDAMERIVSQYIRRAEAELERALRSRIEQYIDGRFVSKDDLDLLFSVLRRDQGAADELKNTLENKRNELEARIRTAAEAAATQAVDEARQQGQQAIQDVLQGRPPTTPALPALPALPRR
jgi:uncharacterized protein (TIGR03545 family)